MISRNGKQYVLAFEDDFSGDTLDSDKWNVYHDRYRRSCLTSKDNLRVADGFLEIIFDTNAAKTNCSTTFVVSKLTEFRRGYYEFQVRPQVQSGFWSALWLHGHDKLEIDILEYFCTASPCSTARHYHVLHWYTPDYLWTTPHNYSTRDNSAYTAQNIPLLTVGLEWTASGYKFYLDGLETANETNLTHGTTHGEAIRNENVPQDIIMSATSELSHNAGHWGGSITGATYPASFYIDYVRYYEPVD